MYVYIRIWHINDVADDYHAFEYDAEGGRRCRTPHSYASAWIQSIQLNWIYWQPLTYYVARLEHMMTLTILLFLLLFHGEDIAFNERRAMCDIGNV